MTSTPPQVKGWFLTPAYLAFSLDSHNSFSLRPGQGLSDRFTGILPGAPEVGLERGIEQAGVRASHPWFKQSNCMFLCFACLKSNRWLQIWKWFILNPYHFFLGFCRTAADGAPCSVSCLSRFLTFPWLPCMLGALPGVRYKHLMYIQCSN